MLTMSRITKRISKKSGLPPETVIYTGEAANKPVSLSLIEYNENEFSEVHGPETPISSKAKIEGVSWTKIYGISNTEIIEKIGHVFKIDSLVLEDIANSSQRPKLEEYSDYFYLILNNLYSEKDSVDIKSEQISIIHKKGKVISFHESDSKTLYQITERIKNKKGKIRFMGADFLVYSLLDAIVDHYFVEIEKIDIQIDLFESTILDEHTQENLSNIHKIKKDIMFIRKSIWPLREILINIIHGEIDLIEETTLPYYRDIYDHVIQVVEIIDSFQDMVSDMIEIYLSSINIKMNETMKVLTTIATIFIPLTFITGIFGMNFKNLPGLDWEWGFFISVLMMFLVIAIMFIYFKRKKLF
jgi:magnesium transporter